VQNDDKLPVDLWRKAVDQGNAVAQNDLAAALENGRGIALDLKGTVAWYRKSADQGYARAQGAVSRLFASHGVRPYI
jgi:uncharacterized protein